MALKKEFANLSFGIHPRAHARGPLPILIAEITGLGLRISKLNRKNLLASIFQCLRQQSQFFVPEAGPQDIGFSDLSAEAYF